MLNTEERNPHTLHIDQMTTAQMLSAIQAENLVAVKAVGDCLPAIGRVVDAVSARMKEGGRLFYIGCGSSGRLGVLDAAECPPTYGVAPDRVIGIIAGGDSALRRAAEGVEDDGTRGREDFLSFQPNEKDSLIGISAAGGAAYVWEAMQAAQKIGCFVAAITANANTAITQAAQVAIIADTGAEAVTGSTRMKAGSAQKMILNMISTAVMIKTGHVYENMMINLHPTNQKLRRRMIRITDTLLACGEAQAEQWLERGDWDIRTAIALFQNEESAH